MKKLMFGCIAIASLIFLAACTPQTEPPESAAVVAEPTVAEVVELPNTPTAEPTATDLPAPRVEPTAQPTATTASEVAAETEDRSTEAETETEEIVEEAEPEPEADTAEVANESFYGRTAEGAFTIGYDSAPVKIIDYSDFL